MEIIQSIQNKIYEFRGERVMLDYDLAFLYEVPTKVLNQAVKRNIKRFPADFMFRLSINEWQSMRSQIVTAFPNTEHVHFQGKVISQNKRNTDITPFAFTEQGIAMLSGVLHSDIAIQMNIAIMRAFVEIRHLLLRPKNIKNQLLEIVAKLGEHDQQFKEIYEAMENLLDEKAAQRKWEERERIGFKKSWPDG